MREIQVEEAKRFAGGDGVLRGLDSHLAHLEQCAKRWESGAYGKPSQEQAALVRAMADRLKLEACEGAIDDRQAGNVDP